MKPYSFSAPVHSRLDVEVWESETTHISTAEAAPMTQGLAYKHPSSHTLPWDNSEACHLYYLLE